MHTSVHTQSLLCTYLAHHKLERTMNMYYHYQIDCDWYHLILLLVLGHKAIWQ